MTSPAGPEELARLRDVLDRWAEEALATNPLLLAVDRDLERDRWFVRMRGEDKAIITLWLTLRERTLHAETQFMPAPEEDVARCYEYLLRANGSLYLYRFCVGAEDALYLVATVPLRLVDGDELDRLVGAAWAATERYFRTAMRIGYASRFPG